MGYDFCGWVCGLIGVALGAGCGLIEVILGWGCGWVWVTVLVGD